MNDLLILAGCTLSGAIVGGCIGWTVCSIIAGAKILAARQDLDSWRERYSMSYKSSAEANNRLAKALKAIPPKRPRENGAYTKLRRILEGE